MTGNMIKGKGFGGALRYNMEKVEKNLAEVLDHSFVEISMKSILKEVQMIKVMRPNLQKYFYHTSINFPPSEDLTNATMTKIGREYLQKSGFTQHQYIMFRHHDADHPHLHILVNRIGYDGKVLSDSNDFAQCEKILRELEKKYKLTEVISSNQAKERAMTKNELEMMKRTNTPSYKIVLQAIIKNALHSKPRLTCSEFVEALQNKGINILFNQASTGYVSGISYSYEGMIIKGAKLGNDFKWTEIKSSIDYEQERDRTTIEQTNARTKSYNTFMPMNQSLAKQQLPFEQSVSRKLFRSGTYRQGMETKQHTHSTQGKNIGSNHLFSEKSKGLDLTSLVDSFTHGNDRDDNCQSHLDSDSVTFPQRKKKRRRRRL